MRTKDGEPTTLRLGAFDNLGALIKRLDHQLKLYKKPALPKIAPPSDPEEWAKKHAGEVMQEKVDHLTARPGDSARVRCLKAEQKILNFFRKAWESAGYEVAA
jgi:hypothetical protein